MASNFALGTFCAKGFAFQSYITKAIMQLFFIAVCITNDSKMQTRITGLTVILPVCTCPMPIIHCVPNSTPILCPIFPVHVCVCVCVCMCVRVIPMDVSDFPHTSEVSSTSGPLRIAEDVGTLVV